MSRDESPSGPRSKTASRAVASALAAGVLLAGHPSYGQDGAHSCRGLDIDGLHEALNESRFTVSECVREQLRQAEAASCLNAFSAIPEEQLLKSAADADQVQGSPTKGALHGVSIVVKDNIDLAGFATTAGTRALLNHFPSADAEIVRRLRAAGALIFGKTHMHELAFGPTGHNTYFGTVANPYDSRMITGGSSSGTAAAISAGVVSVGLGTDTGGSVRVPAALTGIAGFRPTIGRYPTGGVFSLSPTRDTAGVLAKRVRDILILDGVITGQPQPAEPISLRGLRLGIPTRHFYDGADPEVRAVIDHALAKLEEQGAVLVRKDLPVADFTRFTRDFTPLIAYEFISGLRKLTSELDPPRSVSAFISGMDDFTGKNVIRGFQAWWTLLGEKRRTQQYLRAKGERRDRLIRTYDDYFTGNDVDAIVIPTTPIAARPIAGSRYIVRVNGKLTPSFLAYIQNTDYASVAGLPSISVPVGLTPAGLPVGMEIEAPRDQDPRLLRIALAAETVLGRLPEPRVCGN
jgi:mandelamide amidase